MSKTYRNNADTDRCIRAWAEGRRTDRKAKQYTKSVTGSDGYTKPFGKATPKPRGTLGDVFVEAAQYHYGIRR